MGVIKAFLCVVFVMFCSTTVQSAAKNTIVSPVTGCGYEYLQLKLVEIELNMREDRKSIDQKLKHQKTLLDGLLWAIDQKLSVAIDQMRKSIGHNLTLLQAQSNEMLSQQTACANHDQMRKEIQMLTSKQEWDNCNISEDLKSMKLPIRSCKEEPSKRSGKFMIKPTENDEPFEGYCEQALLEGGWLVIQHRFDGSVDFQRNWTEYRDGFGSVEGEHWLGLERVHRLTSAQPHELLVELKDFKGNYSYARYDEFAMGSETQQYPLVKLGKYTGTAGDSLVGHKSMKFSTVDRDNDDDKYQSCASTYKGAWWYRSCHTSNLNGLYKNTESYENIIWEQFTNSGEGLAFARMLIREI